MEPLGKSDLDFLFHPRSIAIVGTPRDPKDMLAGGFFLNSLIRFGYQGSIYPINPKAKEIRHLKAYPNLMSVPQAPDYVICCLPAPLTPQLIKDCAAKGVKAVAVYTAGFSEANGEGRKLEQELASLARQGRVRLIGPNCMGIYCPSTGLSFSTQFSKEAGCVGLLCQSGGNSMELAAMGSFRGIRFSKVISYGNAADLNEADFLEYLAQDAETKIIGAYIEGVKEGQRFFKTLARVTKEKPVIMLKGGRTEAGIKAAASHTGALASTKERWDALCQQVGVIQVYSLEEMLDLMVAFLYMKPPKGRRVGIIGGGGGMSVMTTDECEGAGLIVPTFSAKLRQELKGFSFEAGSSVSNPVDSQKIIVDRSALFETIEAVANSKEVDLLLTHISLVSTPWPMETRIIEEELEAIIEAGKSTDIPIALVLRNGNTPVSSELFFKLHQRCLEAGLAVYPALGGAALAINRLAQYQLWKGGEWG